MSELKGWAKSVDAEMDYYDLAQAIAKSLKFFDDSENHLYDACEGLFRFVWNKNADVRGVLALCALNERKNKVPTLDLLDLIFDAATKDGHPDTIVYYCLCAMRNMAVEEALARITTLRPFLVNKNSIDLISFFEACAKWSVGDFNGYREGIAGYFAHKSADFNPYMAIPASTVWLDEARPSAIESEMLGNLETRVPQHHVDYIISASCDSKYFDLYAETFIESAKRMPGNFYCHISITDSVEPVEVDERFSVVCQNISTGKNLGPVSSALRYIHACDLLVNSQVPVVTVDFDVAFKRDLGELVDSMSNADAGLRCLANVLPWEAITAGFSIFNQTAAARSFLETMRAYFMQMLKAGDGQWWVDQNALECASRFAGDEFNGENIFSRLDQYVSIPTGSVEYKLARLRAALS